MAEVDLAVLCTAASFRDGLLSILEAGLERFSPADYPVTISPQLVFRLSFREEDFGVANLVRVAVRHDDGEPIAEVSVSVSYQPPAGKELSYYTVVIHQLPMQIRRNGIYVVTLTLNGDLARRIPFQVEAQLPPA